MPRAINEGDVSHQLHLAVATFPLTFRIYLLLALVTSVAGRPWAFGILALVQLRIRITKLDGDIPFQLILETDGLHS